jgi:hypothetical protein
MELVELFEKEGLLIEKPRYEEILAYTWSQLTDEDKARYWARRSRDGWSIVAGADSWEVKRLETMIDNIKDHPSWGRARGG